jgi:hypothetical protein
MAYCVVHTPAPWWYPAHADTLCRVSPSSQFIGLRRHFCLATISLPLSSQSKCGSLLDLTNDPSHCLVCPMNQPLVTECHHEIVGKVGTFLKTCGYTVSLEPRGQGTKAGHTAFLDVVVAEPSVASCQNDGLHSSLVHGNGASIVAEDESDPLPWPFSKLPVPTALQPTAHLGRIIATTDSR